MISLRTLPLWIATALLAILPIGLSLDFGGVLAWSQYAAALVIAIAAICAVVGLFDSTASTGLAQHRLMVPIAIFAFWSFFQTITLPAGLVELFSRGSYEAYTRWLTGLVPSNEMPTRFPISVASSETAHVAGCWFVLLALAWASSILFHARSRLAFLLSAIALSGASVAIVGILRKLNPEADWWFITPDGGSFAGFVNRNSAALMLNLGLGAALGLLSWRMMALHAIEFDDPDFEFNDLVALVSDRESLIGIVSSGCCLAGLLVNGSRGGVVAMLFALIVAFGYVRPRRGRISVPVVATVIAFSVAILTVPFQLSFTSLIRLELLTNNAKTLQSDGRLTHWQDGLVAATSYLPAGSGGSTYRYAYLPFQNQSGGSWFEHADNMWLEVLVEYGVFGIAAVLAVFGLLIYSLQRLGDSVDPLDQGIRVAGWYCMTAVFVSQWFDFGMFMPANMIAALMLAAAVISRDVANGTMFVQVQAYGIEQKRSRLLHQDSNSFPTENSQETIAEQATEEPTIENVPAIVRPKRGSLRVFMRRFRFGLSAANALVAIGLMLAVLPALKKDAQSESLSRRIVGQYRQLSLEADMMERVESSLSQSLTGHPDIGVAVQLATVQRDRGRLAETLEWRPDTLDQAYEIYMGTNLEDRQVPYPPPMAKTSRNELQSLKHYREAHASAQRLLLTAPLTQMPRATMLQLQSVMPDAPEIPIAINHLMRFYGGEPSRLIRLGDCAMQINDVEQATKAYRRAAEISPTVVNRLMPLIRKNEDLTLEAIVPDSPEAIEIAAADVLQWETPDEDFLKKAVPQIQCDRAKTLAEKAICHDLLARIQYRLGRLKLGLEQSEQAIRLVPDNATYRLNMIDQLMRNDQRNDALTQARAGRTLMPNNPKFQEIIDQIAALDLQIVVPDEIKLQRDKAAVEDILK